MFFIAQKCRTSVLVHSMRHNAVWFQLEALLPEDGAVFHHIIEDPLTELKEHLHTGSHMP